MLNAGQYFRLLCFLLCLGVHAVLAQNGSVASGGEGSGVGGSVSYSIGLALYTSTNSAEGTSSAGIQNAYTISIVTGLEETSISLVASVYPNPTVSDVVLQVNTLQDKSMKYQLYDMNGILLRENEVVDKNTFIGLSEQGSKVVILKILNKSAEIKSFKIVKN